MYVEYVKWYSWTSLIAPTKLRFPVKLLPFSNDQLLILLNKDSQKLRPPPLLHQFSRDQGDAIKEVQLYPIWR